MKKKIYLLKSFLVFTIKKTLVYRIYLISNIFSMVVIPIIINYFMWKSLLSNNNVGMTFHNMMTYIIISNIILLFTQVHLEQDFSKDIKSPKLGQKMLRPIGYISSLSLNQILSSFVVFVFIYVPIIFLTVLVKGITFNSIKILYSLIFVIIGYILNSLLSLIIGSSSFWLTEIWGVCAIRNLLTGLLAGAYFPLDILPNIVKNIMVKLPFPYMSYFPTKILVENNTNFTEIYNGIIISILWIILLKLISSALIKAGLKKYSLYGA